ncbi:MAG: hypothetical protein ACTHQ3_19845 [Motilibacteraceae bacterium]
MSAAEEPETAHPSVEEGLVERADRSALAGEEPVSRPVTPGVDGPAAAPLPAAVPGAPAVVVGWWDVEPPGPSLDDLAALTGRAPLVVRLSPRHVPRTHGDTPAERAVLAWRRGRRRVERGGIALSRRMVRLRGGTRPARLVLKVTRQPRLPVTDTSAATRLAQVLPPGPAPLLVAVTDTRSAAAAWTATQDREAAAVVLGLEAAARLVAAVGASDRPWSEWIDVAGDTDPDHVYAVLPGPCGEPAPAPHTLEADGSALALPPAGDGPTRLLIAPANYAGQGAAWAVAVQDRLGVRAQNLHVVRADAPFVFAADHPVTSSEWTLPAVRRRIVQDAVGPATHVLLESMRPIVDVEGTAPSGWDFAAGGRDARALLAGGRRLAVLLHGSESRTPDRHAEVYPHSPFRDAGDSLPVRRLRGATEAVHAQLDALREEFGVGRFVSTPDMLDFVPGATWLPVVVRRDAFVAGVPALERRRPVVLHAPSNPLMKGSDVVDAAMARLHDAGLIEYRRLTGVPPALVGDLVRDADVVVDQVALGNLGVMALEAMASGRLVLAHALPEVLARYGEDVPLVLVDPTTLSEVVADVVARREHFAQVAARGPEFVRRHHDGRRSAAAIAPFLGV